MARDRILRIPGALAEKAETTLGLRERKIDLLEYILTELEEAVTEVDDPPADPFVVLDAEIPEDEVRFVGSDGRTLHFKLEPPTPEVVLESGGGDPANHDDPKPTGGTTPSGGASP